MLFLDILAVCLCADINLLKVEIFIVKKPCNPVEGFRVSFIKDNLKYFFFFFLSFRCVRFLDGGMV